MFIIVCQTCQSRWSCRQLPSPFSLAPMRCPRCQGGNLLSLGNIPGVTAPPLIPDEKPLTLPIVLPRIRVPRPTPPPPVFMLTNFSETTDFAQLFGTSACSTLKLTLRDRVDLLFSLPQNVCQILHTCPNPSVTLVQLIDALHPVNMQPPAALDSTEIGACVLLLCQGRGQLLGGSMVKLLHTLASSQQGIVGQQISELFGSLIKANSQAIAPSECEAVLDALLSGGEKLTPTSAAELIKFLLRALTPKRMFDVVLMLHSNGAGLSPTGIKRLFVKMCANRKRSEVIGFCDLAERMVTGSNSISPPEFFDLTILLLHGDDLNPPVVEELYKRLLAELNPKQTRELCLCFLTPVLQPLTPRQLNEMILLLLEGEPAIGPALIVELAGWLMQGGSALSPTAFYTTVRTLVGHTRPLAPKKFHGFAKHLLTHVSEPLNPTQFEVLIAGLLTGTAPLTPEKALNLCSGVLQDPNGLTPRQLRTFLAIFSAAALDNSVDIHALVTQFFKEGLRGQQMLAICTELVIIGPTGLDIAQTRQCVKLLRDNNAGLQTHEVVVLVHGLCGGVVSPLSPQDFRQFLVYLLGTPSALLPGRVLTLFQTLCTGVGLVNPTETLQLLTAYCGHATPLAALEFVALVESLATPMNGLTPTQIHLLLSKLCPGPSGLAPARARALVALLMAGIGSLRPDAIYTLMDLLFNTLAVPTGIRSLKSAALLEWLIAGDGTNGTTPQRASQLIQSLLNGNHLTRQNICDLTGESSISKKHISPGTLYNLSQVVGFPAAAAAAFGAANMTIAELIEIIVLAREANIDAAQIHALVVRIPNIGHSGNESRPKRARLFIQLAGAAVRAGRATWQQVFSWLADFVNYWAFGNSFNDTGETFSNGIYPVVNLGGNLRISGGRINYFCNSHSYRYCDFTTIERAGDQGDITFFTPSFNRGQIETEVTNFVNNHWAQVNELADEAWDTGTYQAKIIGIVEIGCRRVGGLIYITHYVPGGNRIPVPVLKALWKLLRA